MHSIVLNPFRKKTTIFLIYLTALSTGSSWTILPSLSEYIVGENGLNLPEIQYSYITLILNIGAILAALNIKQFRKILSIPRLLTFSLAMMGIFQLGIFLASLSILNEEFNFFIIAVSEFFIGIGIALNISLFNFLIFSLFPNKSAAALVAIYGSISIGSSITALIISFLVRELTWYIIPILSCGFLLLVAFFSLWVSIKSREVAEVESRYKIQISTVKNWKFLGFILIVLLYTYIESTFNYWSPIYLHEKKTTLQQIDAISLSTFWGSVAIGQVLSAMVVYKISARVVYLFLIFLLVFASLLFLFVSPSNFLPFLLGGFGCSAFLPLTIDFFEKEQLTSLFTSAGFMIGMYFLGVTLSLVFITNLVGIFGDIIQPIFYHLFISVILLFVVSYFFVLRRKSKN